MYQFFRTSSDRGIFKMSISVLLLSCLVFSVAAQSQSEELPNAPEVDKYGNNNVNIGGHNFSNSVNIDQDGAQYANDRTPASLACGTPAPALSPATAPSPLIEAKNFSTWDPVDVTPQTNVEPMTRTYVGPNAKPGVTIGLGPFTIQLGNELPLQVGPWQYSTTGVAGGQSGSSGWQSGSSGWQSGPPGWQPVAGGWQPVAGGWQSGAPGSQLSNQASTASVFNLTVPVVNVHLPHFSLNYSISEEEISEE